MAEAAALHYLSSLGGPGHDGGAGASGRQTGGTSTGGGGGRGNLASSIAGSVAVAAGRPGWLWLLSAGVRPAGAGALEPQAFGLGTRRPSSSCCYPSGPILGPCLLPVSTLTLGVTQPFTCHDGQPTLEPAWPWSCESTRHAVCIDLHSDAGGACSGKGRKQCTLNRQCGNAQGREYLSQTLTWTFTTFYLADQYPVR